MLTHTRRTFLKTAGLVLGTHTFGTRVVANSHSGEVSRDSDFLRCTQPAIQFVADGVQLTPFQYATLLRHLTSHPQFQKDTEGKGGVLAKLEQRMASITGKAAAIYMPTGTMANQLAIRVLSEGKSKVYAQHASHLVHNEADAAQVLHGKRVIGLASGRATFSLDELISHIDSFRAREIFRTEIGAISIENPVRLLHERIFDITELRRICAFARDNDYGLHLDGARIHMASAYSGISIKEYCSYFDTVYISLYKYFGASAGAVLCGPANVIERMPHLIKICGGNMATNWSVAAIALHFVEDFEARYRSAVERAAALFRKLNQVDGIRIESFSAGSNAHKMFIDGADPDRFRRHLARNGKITVPRKHEEEKFMVLKVNESLNFVDLSYVVGAFREAYKAAAQVHHITKCGP